ncbi:MAG: chalcone isomerase family protein [Planctomycetota bacterium]
MLNATLTCLGLTALLTLGATSAPQEPVKTVRERQTKVEFPVRIAPAPTDAADAKPGPDQVLAGMALRDKYFVGIDVYAFGLYVDPRAVEAQLGAWKDKSAKELGRDQSFYDALYAGEPIPKSLRMVFVRNVDGEDVADAFEGSLKPRVKRAKDELELGDATAALATFKGFFSLDKLRKGNEVLISVDAKGRLTTRVDGQVMPAVDSPALAWALFDVFLGTKPIEDKGKRDVIARMPEVFDGLGEPASDGR